MRRRTILIGLIVVMLGGLTATVVLCVRRDKGEKPLKRAGVALRAGKFERAAEIAEEYSIRHPNDWRGHQLLGQAMLRLGIHDKAREAFVRAAKATSDKIEPVLALARTYSLPAGHILARPRAAQSKDVLNEAIRLLLGGAGDNGVREDGAIDILIKAKSDKPEWDLDLSEQIGLNHQMASRAYMKLAQRLMGEAESAEAVRADKLAKARREAHEKAVANMNKAATDSVTVLLDVVQKDASRTEAAGALMTMCIAQIRAARLPTAVAGQKEQAAESLAQAAKAILAVDPPPAIAATTLAVHESDGPEGPQSFAVRQMHLWKLVDRLDVLHAFYPDEAEIKLAMAEALLLLVNKNKTEQVSVNRALIEAMDIGANGSEKKKLELALTKAKRLLAAGDSSDDEKAKIKKLLRDATRLKQRGRLEEADLLCGQVIKAGVGAYRAMLLRGRTMMKQATAIKQPEKRTEKYKQIERFLGDMKSSYSNQTEVLANYAQVCEQLGYVDAVREAMRMITRVAPEHGPARRYMAESLMRSHFYRQAFVDAKAYHDHHPDDPAAVSLFVRAATMTEQPKLAEKAMQKAMEDYPDRPEMMIVVSDGYKALGKSVKAGELIRRVADLKPTNPESLLAVARAKGRVGRTIEAERLLQTQIELDPGKLRYYEPHQPLFRFALGRLYRQSNRVFQAMDMFRLAIALDAQTEAYRVALAEALFAIDDLDGCKSVLDGIRRHNVAANELRDDWRRASGKAVSATGQMLTAASDTPRSGAQLAKIHLQRDRPDKCVAICLDELKKTPEDATLRWLLGQGYLALGEREKCLEQWTILLKTEPMKLSVYLPVASVLSLDRKPAEVAKALSDIPGAKPVMVDLTMGWLLMRQKYGDPAATEAYARVIARADAPAYLRDKARLGLARSLAAQGDTAGAIRELDALARKANWKKIALKAKTEILAQAGNAQTGEALKEYKELSIESRDIAGLQHVIQIHVAMNHIDQALAVCRQTQELFPKSPRALMMHANVLTKARRPEEAFDLFRKVIELQPMNFKAHIALATGLNAANRPGEAIDVLVKMEKVGPEARAGALLARGQMLASWGLGAQASQCYEKLISLPHGRIPEIQVLLARALVPLGRSKRARQLLKEVPSHSGHYMSARLLLADIAETNQEKLDIINTLDKAVPGSGDLLVKKMSLLLSEGKGNEAIKAYHAFAKVAPKGVQPPAPASFMAMHHLLRQGHDDQAAKLARTINEQTPSQHWRALAALLTLDTDPVAAGLIMGKIDSAELSDTLLGLIMSVQQGDKQASDKWAARLEQIVWKLAELPKPRYIPAQYAILAALATGNKAEARKQLHRSTSIGTPAIREMLDHPGSAAQISAEATQLLKATLAIDFGLPETGEKWAMSILTKRPQCQWAAVLIAGTKPGDTTLQKVIDTLQPPDCDLAKLMRASLLEPIERYKRLAEIYAKAAEAEQGNVRLINLQARATESCGKLEEALALYRRVLQVSNNPTAANNAAYIVSQLYPRDKARLREALRWADKAVKAVPQAANVNLRETRGWILFLLGEKRLAQANARSAIKQLNRSIEAHYHLGVIEADAGNAELSQWHMAAAVDLANAARAAGTKLSDTDARSAELAKQALKTAKKKADDDK